MTESNRLASLNARIANAARVEGRDSQRIRRTLAFQRLLARMADSGWVLKGGYCLEARLPRQARATQDIDFVRRQTSPSEDELLDELDAVLGRVLLDDGFSFDARSARLTRAAEDPAPASRVRVDCLVDGRLFEPLKLDVVSQFDEVAEAVERLVVVPPIAGEGIGAVIVPAVDVYQHAAEKFHALGRLYAGERPSSRVKDLVDLVLLSEAGLVTDRDRLARRVVAVHEMRGGAAPPMRLPEPPRDWDARYARLVVDLDLTPESAADAFVIVQRLYREAIGREGAQGSVPPTG